MKHLKYKIKNKIAIYLGLKKTLLTEVRPSSYPFISGDTFRSIADFLIENDSDLKKLRSQDFKNKNVNILFISAGFISKLKEENLLQAFDNHNYLDKVLIIHNGDYLPSIFFLCELGKKFSKIFCVNSIIEKDNIYPIPIGLENLHYIKNGITSKYLKYKNLDNQEKLIKTNLVFSSFNIDTNRDIRRNISNEIKCSRFKLENHQIPHDQYLDKLSKSYFCISPPGNGFDCHRTWEGIYLGAIPVVLKGYLANSLVKNLPILEVESYKDFLSKNDDELLNIYKTIKNNRSNEMAFFYYWENLIFEKDICK
jgi:hypothetical protein